MNIRRLIPRATIAALCCAGIADPMVASAEILLDSPSWQIGLTDAGYSDYLGDLTPGSEFREYLSGEWGAAVGYRTGEVTVAPTWLERNFIYPDWQTNSNFNTLTPMDLAGTNGSGLPIARSVLANDDISIAQRVEIVDTVTGMAMGTSPASAGGAGGFINSNRYVMIQSYSITNLSSTSTVGDLQFFQFLHGFNAQAAVYDDRSYGGALGEYRYDVTQRGRDDVSASGQFDYIAFHSKVAPSAFEVGRYGQEGIDDHSTTGKPGTGVHLAVENNWQGSHAGGNGTDTFAPETRWVAGAQRWDLGVLAPGQTVVFDVALSIRTGWLVNPVPEGGASGSINGGSQVVGGVDYAFESLNGGGTLFADYETEDANGIQEFIAQGQFGPLTFAVPGSQLQFFNLEFEGTFAGQVLITFGYDPTLLPTGFDPSNLRVFHWTGTSWEMLAGTVDAGASTISFQTDSLSPFAIGAVPEPETWSMLMAGFGLLLVCVSRARKVRSASVAVGPRHA